MDVEVWPDAEMAAAAAADRIAACLTAAVLARGTASLALSGGSTPRRMFEELAKLELAWEAIHVFQADERLAPDGHAERNVTDLRAHLLAHVSLPSANFHPMPVGLASLDDAAERYERVLGEVAGAPPVLDVVHLGLGADGHTASLFTGDAALESERDVAVTAEHHGWRRLTLTLPAIRRARTVLWLVTGTGKRGAISTLLAEGDVPAAMVDRDDAVVIADRHAVDRDGLG